MLVGNKSDLASSRKTSRELGERFAEEEGLLFAEASAKSGEGVEGLFMDIGTFFFFFLCYLLYFRCRALWIFHHCIGSAWSGFAWSNGVRWSGQVITLHQNLSISPISEPSGQEIRYQQGRERAELIKPARKLPLSPPKPPTTSASAGKVKVTPGTTETPSACNC